MLQGESIPEVDGEFYHLINPVDTELRKMKELMVLRKAPEKSWQDVAIDSMHLNELSGRIAQAPHQLQELASKRMK
jgi:hypothetical protein